MKINYLKGDGTTVGFDSTVSAAAQTQLIAAAKIFTDAFVDPININIQVTFGALVAWSVQLWVLQPYFRTVEC